MKGKKSPENKQKDRENRMQMNGMESAAQWAVRTFGTARFGDQRRTQRAVTIASALGRDPMGSLPAQMGNQAATKAAYRFLQSPPVTYERLMRSHLEQTHALMKQQQSRRVLLIQDMTELDYQPHPKTRGLGPVGRTHHQGYLLQTVLAVEPQSQQVLGIAAQEPFLRQPAPQGETSKQRDKRVQKESQVWQRQVQRMGAAPAGCEYIHVGDRGSDIFAFLRQCQRLGGGFLVRVKHDRRVDLRVEQAQEPVPPAARRRGTQRTPQQEPPQHLFEQVRSWSSRGHETLLLDGNQKRLGREATLSISWGQLRPPEGEAGKGERPMVVTVLRTWEAEPPEGVKALEWLLLSSVSIESEEQAWEQVGWYRMRWIVEDYHQCLKTGCQIEQRQEQTYDGLRTLLGFLAPLAVRLLHLRTVARQQPERAASEILPAEVVQVVAHLSKVAPEHLTARRCWHRIAQAGGYLGRKSDGEPGWKTLWKGWMYIQTLLEGVHLATQFSLE